MSEDDHFQMLALSDKQFYILFADRSAATILSTVRFLATHYVSTDVFSIKEYIVSHIESMTHQGLLSIEL